MELPAFEFTDIEIVFLSICMLAFIYQLVYYFKYIFAVKRYDKKVQKNMVRFVSEQVPVSVIICAKDEVENLRKFLPFVLDQDYPDFEVVVVNDGSTDDTEDYLDSLKKEFPRLRSTFVPAGATNLSTKKLALTLGVKAAKNDWLLFTDADCMPEDKLWIARMARNFTQGTEFVLGYGAYFRKKGFLNKLITFDTLFIALQYLGFALNGKPYMGVGRNLAYRKDVFYRRNGFASTLNLRSGDDDLMVNGAANEFNTKVEVSFDSITWSEPSKRFSDWIYQKERHLSVSPYYTAVSRFRLGVEPAFRALFYIACIASLVVGNYLTMIAVGVLFLVRLIVQISIINASSKHFDGGKYYISVLFFDIFLPLNTLALLIFGRKGKKARNMYWK